MGDMTIHPVLRPYVGIADLLVRTFADCEVVLHDLTVPQRSVVYVANPVVTGRKVGESFEHLIEEAIKAGNPEDGILANYYFEKNGRLIRSSTLLIRDDSERLVGALCINLDTRAATQAMDYLSSLLPGLPPSGKHLSTAASIATKPHKLARELPEQGVQDFVADFVDRIVQEDAGGERLSREARLRMLEFMDRRGVFLVKGSIELVAQKLNLAKATLYGDLDTVRGRRKTDKN